MSAPLFLVEDLRAQVGATVTLTGDEARHAATVKRLTVGEAVTLADGAGHVVEATVAAVPGKDQLIAQVVRRYDVPRPRPAVTIVQALPKSERSELAVDLATQAGADRIIPWQAQRCVARWSGPKTAKHVAKWRSAARAAAKQSRRAWVPEITEPVTTAQLAGMIDGHAAYVLHEEAQVSVRDIDVDVAELFLIVGPEGGIGPEELAALPATAITLGPEVYRTASAAMVALSAVGVLSTRW